MAGEAEAATVYLPVDPLTNRQTVNETTGSNSLTIESPLLGSVNRTLSLATVLDPSNSDAELDSRANVTTGGRLTFSNGVDNNGLLTIDYGTFGPVNFTPEGTNSNFFELRLDTADLTGTTITVTINGIPKTTNQIVTTPNFISFDLAQFAGLDPNNVTSLSITVDPPTAGDVTISFIGVSGSTPPEPPPTTPEPATMLGLLAIAGLGLTVLKNRKA